MIVFVSLKKMVQTLWWLIVAIALYIFLPDNWIKYVFLTSHWIVSVKICSCAVFTNSSNCSGCSFFR